MKKNEKRLLALLLALVMALSLCACGKGKDSDDPNHFDFGKYDVVYKGAYIMTDMDGDDALCVNFDFTNNSDSDASYGWTVFEKVVQDKTELTFSTVYTDLETYSYVGENSFTDVAPGDTIEVGSSYKLIGTDKVKFTISDLWDKYSYTITIDPSSLDHVESKAEIGENDVSASGGTQGFGDFVSVLVPDEFTFERDSWNEDNPHYVSIVKSDWTYFNLHNYTTEEEMTSDYNYVKKTYTNEQVDVSANYGGIDWVGFQYGDGFGGYCFELYAIIGNNYLRVDSAGLAFDDPISVAVLGSIVMAGSDADTPDTSELGGDADGENALIPEWLTWWEGDWYGWWIMMDATGAYEEISDSWWDTCAVIDVYEDLTGYIELWDVDGSRDELLIGATVLEFSEDGEGEHGTMYSVSGQFMDDMLEDGDWVVDPGTLVIDNMITIQGQYEGDEGSYTYKVYLRPWGTLWDDLEEGYYPASYYDWYLPLLDAGSDMPDSFE